MPMILIEKPSPRVTRILLHDPDTLNAMSFPLVEELYQTLDEVGADNACDVVILTGHGRGFCSGLNLEDVGIPPGCEGLSLARIADRSMGYMSDLVPAMRRIPQPILRRVARSANERLAGSANRHRYGGWESGQGVVEYAIRKMA